MKKRPKIFKPSKPKLFILNSSQFFWSVLTLIIISLIAVVIYSNTFTIKEILCHHDQRPCSLAIEAELDSLKGKSILNFRADQLENKLSKADFAIGLVTVNIKLPHTIRVVISPRHFTTALSQDQNSTQLVLVDSNFVPFEIIESNQESAKIISDKVSSLSLGEPINDPLLLSSINLFHTLNEHFISFTTIQTQDNRLKVVLKNKTQVLFPQVEDFTNLVTSLQLILRQATIAGKPNLIDLRFQKPVLRF